MNNETLETTLKDNNILETELSDSKVLETEVTGIQKSMETDHSKLNNLDYEHSGHTGFQPAGNYIEDSNYVHTDNNYTTEEKIKLSNLENYDDTEIKADINSLEGIETAQNEEIVNIKATLSDKADKSEIPDISGKQDLITSTNKLDASYIDDSLSNNKFVTPTEKTNWNNKSDFSGDYNDLNNKPTIPVVPSNVSAFTNDSGYLTSGDLKTINGNSIVGSGNIDVGGEDTTYIGTSDDFNTEAKAFDLTGLDKGIYLLTTTSETGFVTFWVKAIRNSELKTYALSVHRNIQPIMNNICYLHIIRKVDDALTGGTIFGYFTCFALVGGNYLYKFKRSLSFNSTSGALSSSDNSTYQGCMTTSSVDTITAKKTFNVLPESSVTPTTNNQLTNKSYVDSAITSAIGTALGGSY